MRKAILVATSVAFLFSASLVSAAGIKKTVSMPSLSTIVNSPSGVSKSGGTLSVRGPLVGEHIPAGSGTSLTPLSLLPTLDLSIPGIASKAKSLMTVKGGLAGLAGTVALQALLDQIGAIIDQGGTVNVPSVYVPPSESGSYQWQVRLNGVLWGTGSSPQASCDSAAKQMSGTILVATKQSNGTWKCLLPDGRGEWTTSRSGDHCPSGSSYDSTSNQCQTTTMVPATTSNLGGIDSTLPAADPDFIRRVASESCSGSISPDKCIQEFTSPNSPSLSGPTSVQGPSQTTTTTGPAGTTTSTTTTNWTITYGPDYFVYTPTTTTTTTNPDGSTSTSTTTQTGAQTSDPTATETMPNIPDMFGGMNDQLSKLPPEIAGQGASGSSLPYSSWFNMGGSCKEHSFYFGVVGTVTTNYCPIHEQYVRPFLYFIFALWTWHTCFAIWAQRVTMVRAN